jgi:catechol 2,3-dioxygenase-like lactoylglutathione lyase family enzyme
MDLNQVTLPSTDVARSAAFYRALGFTLIVSSLPSYARFECPIGAATFSLHQVASVPENSGVVVYFECVDLDATCRQLKHRGVILTPRRLINLGSGGKPTCVTRMGTLFAFTALVTHAATRRGAFRIGEVTVQSNNREGTVNGLWLRAAGAH